MRKLIVWNLMSLDGFFESSEHQLDWVCVDDEFHEASAAMLREADTLVFGAATFRLMAAYWPTAPPGEVAERMNALEKVVFSTTLDNPSWTGARLVRGGLREEIERLKALPGRDMAVLGSGRLSSALLRMGLVDEYRVVLQPVLLGCGTPLFQELDQRISLELKSTHRLASGVVVLSYAIK